MSLIQNARQFLADERGSNAIEYGLIASLIAVAIIVAVTAVGSDLSALFTTLSTELKPPAP
jgi:pilus assembly protein Flp/PilA